MPTIRVDDEVFEGLKKLAEPLVDTPGSVIRRLLEGRGVLQKPTPRLAKRAARRATRSEEDQTPQSVYERHLLAVLSERFDGKGDKRSVTLAVVEQMMKHGLIGGGDLEFVATGETKAENKIVWGRNLLKDRGLIRRDSRRGVWELTAEGRAEARRLRTAKGAA